jgi:hypothetical protein
MMPKKDLEARRAYHREYMRKRFRTDPEYKAKHMARVRKNDARYRAQVVALISDFRANGCLICPEKTPCCLVAHHVDPSSKLFEIGNSTGVKISATLVRAELAKCVCLCANCHAKVHANLVIIPLVGNLMSG